MNNNNNDESDMKRLSNKLDEIIESIIILKKDPLTINDNQLLEIKVLSEYKIYLFRNKDILLKLKCLLKTISIKSSTNKNINSLLHIRIVIILFNIYERSSNWPIWLLEAFIHDSMLYRYWINVEDENIQLLCKNLYNSIDSINNNNNNNNNNMENIDEISEEITESTVVIDIITDKSPIIINRYSRMKSKVKNTLIKIVEVYMNGNYSVNVFQTLLKLSIIAEIRHIVSKNLSNWIKIPIYSDIVRNLMKSLLEKIDFNDDGNFMYKSDIAVLDDIIKLKSHMLNHLDMYKVSLKIVIQKSNIAAIYIHKGFILAETGSSSSETFKLISSLLKESNQLSQSDIVGSSIGDASVNYYAIKGQWNLHNSKIFLDIASKLLRQCYFEKFSIINFAKSFLTVISNYNLPDPTNHEWLLYIVDVIVIIQLLRYNDSISIDSRDNVRGTVNTTAKSNFINFNELSKSTTTKNTGLLKLSSQVKISESNQKIKLVYATAEEVMGDISQLQEFLIVWLCQRINLKSDEAIELIKHSCCITISPRLSIDVDKKCPFLLKDNGYVTEKIIISIAIIAVNLSKSLEEMSSWIELIEMMCYRTQKSQQQILIDDVSGVLLSLFSLCILDIRTHDNSNSNETYYIKDINFILSSTDCHTEDHPYQRVFLEENHRKRKVDATLPLMVYKVTYWKVIRLIYFLACSRPDNVGKFVWDEFPTLRDLLIMTISGRYENIESSKNKSTCTEGYKKYEGKKGGGVIISAKYLQLYFNSNSCNFEDILQEFESEVWKYLFGDGKSIEENEAIRKRDYERWEIEQEKLALQAKRELQQESRSQRAALRLAKKEGLDTIASECIEVGVKRKLELDTNTSKQDIFPPNYISSNTDPYTTQYGIPEPESIMFISCKDIGRICPTSLVQQIIALDTKYKLGVRLRNCTDPDFISRTLVDCDEQSLNRNIKWLLPTVIVDIEKVLGRLPVSALAFLLRMVVFKVFQRFQLSCVWDFNHNANNSETVSCTFFESYFENARNEARKSLLVEVDHSADMKLITALVLQLQTLFIDFIYTDNSERENFIKIICSQLGHEEFNRRCVSRLLLGYFFKIQSKSSPTTHLDEVTLHGPINCDYISSLKTMWMNLYNNHDNANMIIIDSILDAIKNEGNIVVIRKFLELLQWIEEQCVSLSSSSQLFLSTKAIVLLLSSRPLTARHIMTFMTINEFEIYLKRLIKSIVTSSNQANDWTSDVSSLRSDAVYINVRMIDLTIDSLFERKRKANHNEVNSVAVRVDALRSLLIIAILHESAFDNLNTQIIQCSLSALASFSIADINNYFLDIIALLRFVKSPGYCRLVLAILPLQILLRIFILYSGFSIEFLKASTDTIDKSVNLGVDTWDQILKILGATKGLSKLANEFHPLLKYLEFQSSLSSSLTSSEVIELHPDIIQQYSQQSITIQNISEFIKANDNHLKSVDMES